MNKEFETKVFWYCEQCYKMMKTEPNVFEPQHKCEGQRPPTWDLYTTQIVYNPEEEPDESQEI